MNRLYLDTAIVREHSNNLTKFEKGNYFTSSLVVFELIAGMNEKEFKLRKNVITNLMNSKIRIDWDTYKMKMFKAFDIEYNDIEGKAIKKFAEKLIECKTYEEFKNLKIYYQEGSYFKLESLQEFDKDIEKLGKSISIEARDNEWRKLNKEQRKKFIMQMDKFLLPYSKRLREFALISLAEDLSQSKRPSEEYFKVIEKYDKSLDQYLFYNIMFFLLTEMNGSECGRNDTIDLMHIIYLKQNDTIVSKDKIFNNLIEHAQLINVQSDC